MPSPTWEATRNGSEIFCMESIQATQELHPVSITPHTSCCKNSWALGSISEAFAGSKAKRQHFSIDSRWENNFISMDLRSIRKHSRVYYIIQWYIAVNYARSMHCYHLVFPFVDSEVIHKYRMLEGPSLPPCPSHGSPRKQLWGCRIFPTFTKT